MRVNIFLILLALTCVKMALFISLHVLTLHLKMVLQNEKIGIYLKLLVLYRFKCMFQKSFGWMLSLRLVFLLIECLPLFLMVRFPIVFFFLPRICFLLLLRYLVACFVRGVCPRHTKLDHKSLKYIFLGYSVFKRVIVVIFLHLKGILFRLMLHFLRIHPLLHHHRVRVRGRVTIFLYYELTSPTPSLSIDLPHSRPLIS